MGVDHSGDRLSRKPLVHPHLMPIHISFKQRPKAYP
jgi:hypothetical protein